MQAATEGELGRALDYYDLGELRTAPADQARLCQRPLGRGDGPEESLLDTMAAICCSMATASSASWTMKARWQPRIIELAEALIYFTFKHPDTTDIRFHPEMGGGALLDGGSTLMV